MSLFGSSPPDETPNAGASAFGQSTSSLFEDEPAMTKSTSSALFQDDDPSAASSPWDMPTPRKAKNRSELLKTLLPAEDVPESYIETFDAVLRDSGSGGKITAGGVARTLAAAHISPDEQARIMAIVAPSGGSGSGEVALGRNEFNALLALIGLAQDGEVPNLDGVDERRRSECPLPYPLYAAPCSHLPYLIGRGWVREQA
jgi:sorting nexin-8